jgi:hypothetical protein
MVVVYHTDHNCRVNKNNIFKKISFFKAIAYTMSYKIVNLALVTFIWLSRETITLLIKSRQNCFPYFFYYLPYKLQVRSCKITRERWRGGRAVRKKGSGQTCASNRLRLGVPQRGNWGKEWGRSWSWSVCVRETGGSKEWETAERRLRGRGWESEKRCNGVARHPGVKKLINSSGYTCGEGGSMIGGDLKWSQALINTNII